MKYKMIATDMDGTLLNNKSELTERTKTAIVRAVEAGAFFVAATGRPMLGVGIVNTLFEADMPFIIFNGAAVVMGKSRKVLLRRYLDAVIAAEAFNIGKSRDADVVAWTDDHLYISRDSEITRKYRSLADIDIRVINGVEEIGESGIYKVLWIDEPAATSRHQDDMKAHFGNTVDCYTSQPMYLEFVSKEAGKGSALAEIGRILGIDRSETIAVGDGYNDISMLEYAGLGVAMENAPDDVRKVCGHITLSNDDDGVAAVIDEFILGFPR